MELHRGHSPGRSRYRKMKADDDVYHSLPACCEYRTETMIILQTAIPLVSNVEEVVGIII